MRIIFVEHPVKWPAANTSLYGFRCPDHPKLCVSDENGSSDSPAIAKGRSRPFRISSFDMAGLSDQNCGSYEFQTGSER